MITLAKKICLLGDFAVGKSSLVRRFVYNIFRGDYISTIGVNVSRKTVIIPCESRVVELTMMLWDLAGSAEFDRVRINYLRGAAGGLLVCDLTRPETLDSLQAYARDMLNVNPTVRFAIAANKCDLIDQQRLTPEQVESVASDLHAPCRLTSAKTGEDVEALFRQLGQLLVD
ncbi:MAG: GTP-binding protein [Chloroflexi bacterium]|nr:GTP-binding protein [Chloroflexota bacterium]